MIAFWAILKGLPWRAIGAIALVLAVAACGWRVSVWRDAYKALPGVQDALSREEACEDGSRCYERQRGLQEAAGHATVVAVESYEAELAALRARPAVRRVVRLCADPGPDHMPGTSPAPGADGASPAAGLVHGPAGRDLGPDLYDLARDADEVAARLRALQEYSRAVSQSRP